MAKGCILLKNKRAEKAGTWFGIAKRVTPVITLKGDLLIAIPEDERIPRSDEARPNNYRLAKEEAITVYAGFLDIAPLSDHDFNLLLAIDCLLARYKVFISNEMKWGLGLKTGDAVNVTIQGNDVHAVVRYIGEVVKNTGLFFGVEIMVRNYEYF